MNNLPSLVRADVQTHWIAVEAGSLTVIEKDCRFVRMCKSIASFFTGVDYYQHINRDRVLQAIVHKASVETDSTQVEQYISIAEKIKRGYAARCKILEAHPEMVARFDASRGLYAVPAKAAPMIEVTKETERALQTMTEVTKSVYGTVNVHLRNDARLELLRHLFQTHSNFPMDSSGNYWIGAKMQHKFCVTISPKNIQAVTGPWWKITLPAQTLTLDTSDHPPFQVKERVLYLLQEGALKTTAHKTLQVIIDDQSAAIKPDGTAQFPDGLVCDLKRFHPRPINGVTAGGTTTFTTNFIPFPLTNDELGEREPRAAWDI